MTDPVSTLALCKWLRDRIKEWEAEAKQSIALLQGERKAAVVDGRVLGHVTMAKGRRTAHVANEDAFLAYVKSHHPTEVETLEQVRPSFRKRVLDEVVKRGGFIDADGVVIDGIIDLTDGDPYPMSKLADDADLVIAGLLQRGALGVNGFKALPEPRSRWEDDIEAGAIGETA